MEQCAGGWADDVDGPSLGFQAVRVEVDFDRHSERLLIMRQIVRVGLDIAKRWFQVRGLDEAEKEVFNRKLPRDKVLGFLGALRRRAKSLWKPALPHTTGVARSNGWAIG
jgi:hypothetical protein